MSLPSSSPSANVICHLLHKCPTTLSPLSPKQTTGARASERGAAGRNLSYCWPRPGREGALFSSTAEQGALEEEEKSRNARAPSVLWLRTSGRGVHYTAWGRYDLPFLEALGQTEVGIAEPSANICGLFRGRYSDVGPQLLHPNYEL